MHELKLFAVPVSWSGWKRAAAYFPAQMHKTADLDPAGNYLFACHPHGITSFRQALLEATLSWLVDKPLNGHYALVYVALSLLNQWLRFATAPGCHLQQKALVSKVGFQA